MSLGCEIPLALYLHVPFCGQRCAYCHFEIKIFHPKTNPKPVLKDYMEGLAQELEWWAKRSAARPLASIFLGGGTPSRLSVDQIGTILQAVCAHFSLVPDCEISMEVNPEDGAQAYLAGLRQAGITRLSFGVQSFADSSLFALGRPHSGAQAHSALEAAGALAFPHGRSLDLMLGLPFQTEDTLRQDLALVRALGMEHLSVYMLEVDLPTPLDKRRQRLPMPSEDEQAERYEQTLALLDDQGFEHYEISNFAKVGFRCRHNLLYWQSGDYLGIGPAAHGRVGLNHCANFPRLREWRDAVRMQGRGVQEVSHWTPERFRQEQRIQGMRLATGLLWSELEFDQQQKLGELEAVGLLEREPSQDRIRLTTKGKLLANEVFAVFLD